MVDLNPLHYISKFNHMFGDSVASGLEFLGISDPAVDPDGVREIAKKWRSLASGLDDAATAAERSLRGVEWEGKTAKAFDKRSKAARKQATEMAHALREGAKALDDFADKAHELLSEIGVMLAEIAEFEIAGLALSVLTAGASDVAATLMAGERALKVVALVGRIEEEGTALGTAVRGIMEVIRGVERALKALKEIRGVAAVAKLAKEGATFTAFSTLLEDPGAFKDPEKLAGILAEGAVMGVGFGVLGKALGKGLKALKPSELAKLSKALKLDGSGLSRLKLRPDEWEKLPAGIRNALKECERDPIDVATGDMLLPQVDVDLPGALPLVLERTHLSSYRWGGWFGPSWASTLDQRLQADDEGVVYTTSDGARLVYPLPDLESEGPVFPEFGPRLPLTWDRAIDGGLRVADPDSGLSYVFHSPRPTDDGEAVDLPLQMIVDRNGQHITVHYAADGTPTAVVHSGGHHIALDRHPSLPRISRLRLVDNERIDGQGTVLVSYGYNEDGHLSEVTNSSGTPLHFTYDDAGRITSWTDRNRTAYTYAYDERGRVVRTEGSDGFLAGTLDYDEHTRTTTVTDSLGHVTRYEHNEAYRLLRKTDSLGHVTHQEWDAGYRLAAITDSLGRTTRYAYDEHGQPVSVVRPDGHATYVAYNDLGLPLRVTTPAGAVWQYEYDEHGNRTAAADPSGAATRYTYDRAGHLTSVTDPLGHTTRVRSNRAGLPVEITDPVGAVTRYARDALGHPVTITDPLGQATHLEWTAEGHLTRRTDHVGATESWTYDGEGNCTSHTNAAGAVSRFEYTHFDLVAARTGPDGARYEFTHDTELQLAKVTNPQGLTWSYSYDPAGRPTSETDFDGRTVTYTHDVADRLTSRTNPLGQTVDYEYDVLDQVSRKDADGTVTTFTYDLSGQLVEAATPEAALSLRRDVLGRPTAETLNGLTTTYSYDRLGRRATRTTPSGATSSWTYDAAGRPTELTTAGRTLSFAHDAAGREITRRLSDALTIASVFDGLGRLSEQSVTGAEGRLLQRRAYAYSLGGDIVRLDDQIRGIRHFGLDPVGRVTTVTADGWSENYAYDTAGNQVAASWPDTHPGGDAIGPRTYSGTAITRAGNVRYEHDAAGRITLRHKTRLSRKPDNWRYTWDAEDRLTSVTTPDGTVWRYIYDPLGRRTAKLRMAPDGATITEQITYAWDDTTLCEQTTVSEARPHPVTLTWHHDGRTPLAQVERITAADAPQHEIDSRFFTIVTDLVGTPTELVDEHGTIAWHAITSLWGSTAWNRDATGYTPLRFPGQYHDPETGLHYNYFRHYDPETGRYLTPDPLGLTPSPNPVSYVHNPLTWTDPLGLAPCPKALWEQKADFSSQKVLSKKFDKHAGDFGVTGNRSGQTMKQFTQNMRSHILAGDTKIYRFNYRNQGQAVGFIDPGTKKMVMLHTDGKFWSAWKLGDKQFQSIIDKGFLT
ncbi:DUF6531 domain-containing protein [Streptomyces sp. NPDC054813]